ncbi:hypothetical protein [Paenibacillus sp. MSJ-34]|uniref:hypothetical protein n=1 Tax=Paenibacillus sp. MSJ-34 TaxID=2841529 RepID=UPI001C103607|nr:hypothetical protein [Paenibacillus sp. MSJ-34]MBU5442520.1 hypothetical protein [Paenibacillus sp. MSJ-34]
MTALRKFKYRLKTCSTLALSPRDHHGFYQSAGDFAIEDMVADSDLDKSRVNIIYPFYQYGTYSRYEPQRTTYYIPGSSIKGALAVQRSETGLPRLQVDDIRIESEDLRLYHLYKVQNQESAKIDVFFPNVAVEMLNADSLYSGELFCDREPDRYFREAQQTTRSKLHQLIQKIDNIYDQIIDEKSRSILSALRQNTHDLLDGLGGVNNSAFTLLLGGYKGLVLSVELNNTDYHSAIYLDMKKKLPHGLVQVMLE